MPRLNRWTDDTGSSSLEFITIGMVLLVPLVYLVIAVSTIQAGALAVEGAARQAARVFVLSANADEARERAIRAVEFALADHGVSPQDLNIEVTCAPQPQDCLARRGLVTVTIDIAVALPLVPEVILGDIPLTVPLHATATQQVSRFWGAG